MPTRGTGTGPSVLSHVTGRLAVSRLHRDVFALIAGCVAVHQEPRESGEN